MRILAPFSGWDPATPAEIQAHFGESGAPWWIAGGYAMDFAAGRSLRPHGDIDVLLLHRDQSAVQDALPGWQWWAADPPGSLRPWRRGELLSEDVHDVWCRPSATQAWRIQILLDRSVGSDWVSRRNPGIRRAISSLGNLDGIRYLAPEIQLFYKAARTRDKDQLDFDAVGPLLTQAQRRWLREAVADTYGVHPWLDRLT